MRRTAWILAALGIAGSTLRGYAQESPRASIPVRRTAAATAEAAPSGFYDDLFSPAPADEPSSDARPVARGLADSMNSSRSLDELVSRGPAAKTPAPVSANEAFPTRRAKPAASQSPVTAAALFEATDRPSTVARSGKGTVLRADAPSSVPDEGEVVPAAGTGRSVSTSLLNRNQRVEPSKNTGAPTNVEQHLLMIDELPVDPQAPAMPPRSTAKRPPASELPELDFSAATEEVAAEPASQFGVSEEPAPASQNAPVIRKRSPGIAPRFDASAEPENWDDEPGDAELLDNPFAKFNSRPEPALTADEPLPVDEVAEPAAAFERTTAPPVARNRSPLLDEEPVPIESGGLTMPPESRTPSTNPLRSGYGSGSVTIPSVRRPAAASFPAVDPVPNVDLSIPLPAAEMPMAPPVQAPVRTVRTSPRPSEASSLSDVLTPEPASARPAALREEYITSTPEKTSGSGVTAEWVKKSEIAIGQECECELVVKNRTDMPVREVEVEAYFPANVQLVGTTPAPVRSQSSLIWKFESLNPGETQTIAIRMVPRERGNIATQAYVRFSNASSGSFNVAEPMLTVELAGPHEVMIGETASHTVTIRNPGTGTAANVKVEARIPQGLEHSRGSRLLLDLGALNPGESRPVRLALSAVSGGRHLIEVKAHADGDIMQAAASEVMVVSPRLKADIQGPGLRYLGRRAVYTLSVLNEGSANTENVRVMHKIPEGFEYISSDKGATYSSANRMLSWFVGTMNTGDTAQAHVTLEAKAIGAATHFMRATSEHGVVADAQVTTQVEGAPALVVEITDLDDPVEVGVETGYEIRVKNEGTAPAERVALTCELPLGARFLSAAGAVSHAVRGQMVEFRPIGRLAPGETVKYQVLMRGEAAGNLRFRTQLTSDSITDPLTAEELTKFYGE